MKTFLRTLFPNPFDQLLKKMVDEQKGRFLIVWNRGLGDIPLGLYGLVYRIRTFIPNASISFLTRTDLKEAFSMLEDVQVIPLESWKRGEGIDLEAALKDRSLSPNMFDAILEKPDPTRWLKPQLGKIVPKLLWEKRGDALVDRFDLDPKETYIGCHVQTETGRYYGYEKNWDLPSWRNLFKKIEERKKGKIILFGMAKDPAFLMDGIVDLRGETTLFEMLSVIKNRCRYLVAPDSGVLSMTYYLDAHYPISVVSLWADPKQGVLKQNVPSPNPSLTHMPLVGKNQKVAQISTDHVYHSLFG